MAVPATALRPVTPVAILADELRRAHELAAGLDDYVARCTTPESPALRGLVARTHAEDWERPGSPLEREMLSGHVEGQLLKFLVAATGARRVLEVGMFTGYSALAMAEALPEDGTLVACELDARAARVARECFDASPHGAKITIELGPALDTLAALKQPFDLVFLDADKPGYAAYLEAILDTGLLADGGVIAVDNTLMQGEPYVSKPSSVNGEAIAAFNDAVAADPRVEQVLLPLRDGLTLIRRA